MELAAQRSPTLQQGLLLLAVVALIDYLIGCLLQSSMQSPFPPSGVTGGYLSFLLLRNEVIMKQFLIIIFRLCVPFL